MNDKQQEQNFPSSSIIKDVDNKFHQLLKETGELNFNVFSKTMSPLLSNFAEKIFSLYLSKIYPDVEMTLFMIKSTSCGLPFLLILYGKSY